LLVSDTLWPDLVAAWEKTAAGRACRPTAEAMVVVRWAMVLPFVVVVRGRG
jgi:hypothetical protein